MALTVTKNLNRVERISRNLGIMVCNVAFDSSYPTGGEDISSVVNAFKEVLSASFEGSGGYVFEYDKTNKKVKALYPQGGEQVGSADGGASVDAGATPVTSSAANGAIVTVDAGIGREVANATDLSALTTVRVTFIGYM
jgi:hypothetical protein